MPKRQYFKRIVFALLWLLAVASGQGAEPVWRQAGEISQNATEAGRWIRPKSFHAARLNHGALRELLDLAPHESTPTAAPMPVEVTLPLPDGTLARFRVCESPVMAPELAALYPEIKTYCGQGIDDPAASVRFDTTPSGLHAQILSPGGAVYIDPYQQDDSTLHQSYYKRDYHRDADEFQCLTTDTGEAAFHPAAAGNLVRSGSTLRTYRLAVAATGEYTQFHGGTVSAGLAAIVTAVNRVNGIYETELAIRLVLVGNNDLLVFTDPATDPYSNNDANAMLTENQATIDTVIGEDNYDLGHVFGTGGTGLSSLASVCFIGHARSVTGVAAPTGDPFYVDYVAHEIGHQFGAHHSFNGTNANCNGQRTPSTAFEPGSGSTIMAYASICGADNLQPHSDAYFHSVSFDEIQFYTTVGFGKGCAVTNATGNHGPALDAGPDFTIPKDTPFALTASGSDPDGDALTYCWEQRDLGPAQPLGAPDNGSSPLFRSFPPSTNPSRTFPKLSDILNHTTTPGEQLPAMNRALNFRVTARDKRAGGGGLSTDEMKVTVIGTNGPFQVTSPNTALNWTGTQTVTWAVAGTTALPVGTVAVDVLLSTNGGLDFPILLATNTPNDGSESIVLPDLATSAARLKVRAVGNIFFDISDSDFTITPTEPPSLSIGDASVVEGNSGVTNAQFAVTLSRPAAQLVIVNFATSDSSARAGSDYAAANGTLQFNPGQTNLSVNVPVLGDSLFETSETFTVNLSLSFNATLARSAGVGTILDDEIRIAATFLSGTGVQLEFNTLAGRNYRVERADELSSTNVWLAVPGAALVPGSGAMMPVLDTNAPLNQPQRFYRVRLLEP